MQTRLRAALLALLSVLVLALVACGEEGGGTDTQDPRVLLEKAFSKPVDSGHVSVDVALDLDGVQGMEGPISFSLRGPFQSRGQNKFPKADWDLAAKVQGVTLRGGLKITDDNAFLEFRGEAYEIGTRLFELAEDGGDETGKKGPTDLGLDPASWLDDAKVEEGQDIGGDATRKVTGSVNTEKVVRDALDALSSPELKRQFGGESPSPPDLSERDFDKLREAVDDVHFEANVDEDDVLRRILAKVSFDAPRDSGVGAPRGGRVTVEYALEKVGGDVDVDAPRNPQPLGELLREFGITDAFGLPRRQ